MFFKMADFTIRCPKCQTEIPLTETLARPLLDAERAKINSEIRERTAAIDKREREVAQEGGRLTNLQRSLDAQAAELERNLQRRLTEERAAIAAAEAKKAESQFKAQLDAARREHQSQTAKIAELQKAELEYRQKSAALAEEKRQWELDRTRQIEQEREQIRIQAIQDENKRHQLQTAAKDRQLADLNAKLAEAQRAELEVRQQREALETEKRTFDLQLARRLDAERARIREGTQKEDDERHRLKLAEKDKVIESMARQVDELRRKVDQGSPADPGRSP
jgi:chromosome segregation ATPase